MDSRARARAFIDHLEHATAERVEPWRYGTAFYNSTYPVKYALNFLRLETDDDGLDADTLAREADRVMAAAGAQHRRINGAEAAGKRWDGFKELGWETTRLVLMEHDGNIRSRPGPEVKRVEFADLREAMIRWDEAEPTYTSDSKSGVAEQLADSRQVLAEAVDVSFYAVRLEDQVAGWCELYLRDGTAQVENVMTFERFRGSGVASSVVNRALKDAYAAGADFAFLIADDEDWPKALYNKLGFTAFDLAYEYTLPAD